MGFAEAIPNTDFHARAGIEHGLAEISMVDLQYAVDRVSARFHLKAQQTRAMDAIHVTMPYASQQSIRVIVTPKPASLMLHDAVCAYQFKGPHEVSIHVSQSAHHDHLERALTHEFSEINFALHLKLKHGSEPTVAEAASVYKNEPLAPSEQALRQRLTPHDIGRLSELDFVFGVRGSGGMDAKQQWATLTHLGMVSENPGASKRIKLLNYLPKELIDPRTVKLIQLRLSSPLQPSMAPTPIRKVQPKSAQDVAVSASLDSIPATESTQPSSTESAETITIEDTEVDTPNTNTEVDDQNTDAVAAFHQDISDQLATALDSALDARQIWHHYLSELRRAEDNYAEAAGTTGKALKEAEARCKSIAETLKQVRNQPAASDEIVRLQVSLRQAHFELGQIRLSHNQSISETEVRTHQRHIQVAQTKEEKAQKDRLQALIPVMRLILTTLDIRRQPDIEWAKHSLSAIRQSWKTHADRLQERVGATLTVATDAKEECLRLQRDLQAIAQQLERVEGRNNNQRQVDSLSNRQMRVGQELTRAQRKLDRAVRAYRDVLSEPEVSELRTHCGRWAAKYDSLMTLDALNISSEEDPRTTTRSARLQAIERHIHTTIEHLLAHAETPLNRFLDAWANPNEALDTPEQALTKCLNADEAWEWRDQLTDMVLQQESLLYPNPTPLPEPETLLFDAPENKICRAVLRNNG